MFTADLAAADVRGVQDNGVGATPKHYGGHGPGPLPAATLDESLRSYSRNTY